MFIRTWLFHHRWGTNGIVLELEVALAPALPWLELIATFEAFEAGLDFCIALNGHSPGIVKKELALMAAPIPEYFSVLKAHLPARRLLTTLHTWIAWYISAWTMSGRS